MAAPSPPWVEVSGVAFLATALGRLPPTATLRSRNLGVWARLSQAASLLILAPVTEKVCLPSTNQVRDSARQPLAAAVRSISKAKTCQSPRERAEVVVRPLV